MSHNFLIFFVAEDLFGKTLCYRRVRIMVTLPTQAARNYELVWDLIQRGTDCVRINCAHDSAAEWSAIIANVRTVELETADSLATGVGD
jgi:pyruvate kinase